MRKKKLYKNKEPFYPITHTEAVLCPDGQTVEQRLQTFQNDVESKLSGGKAANVYPFKDLGTCSNIALANNALDTAFVSEDETLQGHLRLIVNGQIMWIDQIAVNYTKGYWLQVVFGAFTLSQDTNTLVSDYSKYHISYRFRNEANTSMAWHDFSTEGLQLKTINGQSLIGTGNIVAGGSGDPATVDAALDPTSINPIQNKAVYDALFGENGLDEKITTIGNAVSAGKVVMVDSWGTKPSSPTTGIVAYVAGEGIYTYGTGGWGNAVVPDATAIYVNKNMNIVYRWDADNEEMDSLVGQEIDDEWVLNSKKPVQSRTIAKRFKKLEIAMFGTEQGNSDETSITNDSLAKDMEDMKDAVFGEEQSGTRSGGLNNTVTDMKEALYGQGGTAQAPAQGSISQKVSNLETEAIKGIKVNGASIEKDQQGIANITVKATGSSYMAQVKSDWTGEDKRTSKLTNFEWSEDTDDAIFVVDPNTKELWLGYCSDKDSDPRTYIYFQEWIDCGPIPSSDTLAANGTTIQYTLGGISHTASYSTSTHKVTELIIGEGATLKAQTKSDWTGETKSDHKLTNFEWSEDADDAILVVDTTNKELWLGYSDMPDTPRTYVYYKEWNQCGSIPASDIIAEKGQLVQYVSDNVTYLATYNATTHRVVPTGGGSSDAIAQIDNSNKPVQSARLQREFNTINGKITNIESNLGISKGNSSFKLLSDSDEAFATFDYSKGNLGCFTPKVAPEEITVADVDSIYTVKLPYGIDSIEELPIKTFAEQEIEGKYLVADTYLELELPTEEESDGTTIVNNHASDNRNRLINAFGSGGKMYDENCIGIKFTSGKRYYVLGTNPTGVANRKTGSIVLPRDFILDGSYDENVNSSGTSYGKLGGLIITTENALFYTEHSLVVNKLYVKNNGRNSNYSFYMDYERGVDQLQVTKCIFESDGSIRDTGSNPKGCFFRLYSPNPRPYRYKQEEYDYVDEYIASGQDTDNKGRDWLLEQVAYSNTSKDSIREVVNKITAEDVIHTGDTLTLENLKLDIPSPSCINHIYIQGCSFEGGRAVNAESLRVVKSCRIINNKFHTIMTPALDIGIANAEKAYDDHSVSIISARNTYNNAYYCNYHRYYASLRSATRCPFYIAGNTFIGLHDDLDPTKLRIYKPMHGKTGGYHTAMLLEGGTFYILHNVIEDIVSAAWYASGSGRVVETYDAYCNCNQLYYENNTVRNIARFSTLTGDVGICKGKNLNISAPYANESDSSISTGTAALTADWYNGIGGGCLSMPFVRHYKNNHYSVDVALLKSSWEHYLSRVGTADDWYNENTSADEKTRINDVIVNYLASSDNEIYGIHFASESVVNSRKYANNLQHPILEEYVFCNNIVDATGGTITGMNVTGSQEGHTDAGSSANDDWPVNKAIFSDNTFIAKEFEHNAKNPLTQRDTDRVKYLFRIKLQRIEPDFKKTYFEVVGNTFICPENVTTPQYGIRFICNRFVGDSDKIYPELASDNAGDTCVIKDNKVIVPQSLLGTNIPIVISKAKTSTATAYEHIRTIVDKELKKEEVGALSTTVSELGRTVEDVEIGVRGIDTILRGESADDISSIIPYNPSTGDKYKVVGADGTKIYTCTGSGAYARVNFRFNSDYNKSATHVIGNIQIPFSPNELNDSIMTKAEIAEAIAEDAKLGAATPVSEYQYINNNVDVAAKLAEFAESENGAITASSKYEAAFVLEVVLKARGYKYASLASRSAMNTLLGTNGKGGFFDIYTESGSAPNTYVRVMPAYAYDSRTFITNDTARGSATSALKNLVKNTSSSVLVYYNGENSYNSLQGSTPSWSEPVLSTGMIDMVGALSSNVTLYHTIIINLLTEINTLRGQHSLSPLVLNDDGTITEQQSS